MSKTGFYGNGDGEILVDMTQDYRDLGLIDE